MLRSHHPLAKFTSVMMVPPSGVVILQQLRPLPRVQQEVHLVLLPPGERLAQELPGFVQVEISSPEEAQHVLIFGNLRRDDRRKIKNKK